MSVGGVGWAGECWWDGVGVSVGGMGVYWWDGGVSVGGMGR